LLKNDERKMKLFIVTILITKMIKLNVNEIHLTKKKFDGGGFFSINIFKK